MLEIRPIAEDEIDDVARVHVRSWQSGYAGIVPEEFLASLDPADFAARRRYTAIPPGGGAVCAVDEGRILGHATFGPYRPDKDVVDRSSGELYSIYVAPEQWGNGTGYRLFATARERLTAAGFPDLRLWVLEDNHRARRFYERQGMRPDGEREVWIPRGYPVELPELRYAVAL
ncbi:MAG TPA: GNAT family N-acetyltransferase [Actinoplanes sp.]|jgi:GNAT superfamily N-acetyltransferase